MQDAFLDITFISYGKSQKIEKPNESEVFVITKNHKVLTRTASIG
jgi:hypothetical protein